MKLTKEETKTLRKVHAKAVKAGFASQAADLELQRVRNEVLVKHDAWGKSFNSDYTEIVDGNKDSQPSRV